MLAEATPARPAPEGAQGAQVGRAGAAVRQDRVAALPPAAEARVQVAALARLGEAAVRPGLAVLRVREAPRALREREAPRALREREAPRALRERRAQPVAGARAEAAA